MQWKLELNSERAKENLEIFKNILKMPEALAAGSRKGSEECFHVFKSENQTHLGNHFAMNFHNLASNNQKIQG